MHLKAYLLDDDRGVSPVIGVILMVAITVILAAVIATFVMNIGPQQNSPANANWDWSNQTDYIELEHNGGGEASVDEYEITVTDDSDDSNTYELTTDDDAYSSGDEMSASDTLRLYTDDDDMSGNYIDIHEDVSIEDVDTVELIWKDPDSDQTQVVDTYEP